MLVVLTSIFLLTSSNFSNKCNRCTYFCTPIIIGDDFLRKNDIILLENNSSNTEIVIDNI